MTNGNKYSMKNAKEYKKTATVHAIQMPDDFTVDGDTDAN